MIYKTSDSPTPCNKPMHEIASVAHHDRCVANCDGYSIIAAM